LEAHVGGTLIKLRQDPATSAIVSMNAELIRYFNRGYYAGWPLVEAFFDADCVAHFRLPLKKWVPSVLEMSCATALAKVSITCKTGSCIVRSLEKYGRNASASSINQRL
jgi:hypothetical protein